VYDTAGGMPLILNDGASSYLYGPGGVPFEQITTAGVATYLHADQLGSIRMITNTTGASAGTASYTAYGTRTTTGTTSAFGYAGQYTDTETGLQWDRARYYDPVTAQFLTVDPLAATTGARYSYAGGNPITGNDPSGLLCLSGTCILNDVHVASGAVTASAGACALIAGLSIVGNAGVSEACGAVALASAAVQAGSGFIRYGPGQESGGQLAIDAAGFGLGSAGYGLGVASTHLGETADAWEAMANGSRFFPSLYYSVRSGLSEAGSQMSNVDNWLITVPTTVFGSWSFWNDLQAC
jgi:RHS repeat-associated protein